MLSALTRVGLGAGISLGSAGMRVVRPASRSASVVGASIWRSHVGSPSDSRSRRLRWRMTKNRKARRPRPAAAYLAEILRAPTGPAAGGVVAGLANATWLTLRTSPRLASMPAAADTAFLSWATLAGGTGLWTKGPPPRRR